MKNNKIISIITLVVLTVFLFSFKQGFKQGEKKGDKNEESVCLEVNGLFIYNGEAVPEFNVEVYMEDAVVEKFATDKKGRASLKLKQDHDYYLRLSKPGFVPRIINISTKMPKNALAEVDIFHFTFEMEMIPEQNNYNSYYLDFPAALVSYDKKEQGYAISQKYNEYIKKMTGEAD